MSRSLRGTESTPAEDIAQAIAYLFSDAGAKMNGKRLALHP